ncbi:MAG TPA: ribonuclease H-like domain-containing protein [Vicinamibacteria bacterium]|nr:ribonuclease H-like domain-containing protein [Vicinamibacteria bacterium]
MSPSLHDRLQQLRRPAAGSALESLERELLSPPALAEGEILPLKARLQRLVAVAAQKERERRRAPAPVPLEELVDGMRVENERGEFFRVDSGVHLEVRHGDVPLSRVQAIAPDTVRVLSGQPELEGFDLRRAVFLDTETTGLAGGSGTAAFLVGLGWFEGERFRVRQCFMRDYHEEPALLCGVAEELARFAQVVTFNGKMFDLPLLETRFRLNRERYPLAGARHLDLLHPARRLWKARLESCRLQALEVELMGLRRTGDLPGEEIPQVYFDWVRRRDAGRLARVFEHNRQDIVSLAALAVHACRWVEEGSAEDPRDLYSLGRVLERAREFEKSETQYTRALAAGAGAVRGPALVRLAWRAERSGRHQRALALWREAAEAGEPLALRQLAIHHEHRTRDYAAALAAVERGLALVEGDDGSEVGRRDLRRSRLAEAFARRRKRLLRKASRSPAAGTPPGPGSAPAS